jgi:polygalacturonase
MTTNNDRIRLNGTYVDWIGTPNVTAGWINSYGQQWWDTNKVNGTGAVARPHLLELNVTHSTFTHLKSWKPIAWGTKLWGENITIDHPVVEATSNGGFPFNTDGVGVSASHVEIKNGWFYNGDDAIAVQQGAHDVYFHNNIIGFETHGMSIGSLGQNQAVPAAVSDIVFDNNVVAGGLYAARFKSWIGGQGLAANITWSNIRIFNVTFPIQVTQRYFNQGSAQTQLQSGATTGRPNNASVILENMTFANFTGNINSYNPGDGSCVSDPCWYNAGYANLMQSESIIIECNTLESCHNITFSNIEVRPQNSLPASKICVSVDAELNPDLGFDCSNGTYVPTI